MGASLIGGLIAHGQPAAQIRAAEPDSARRGWLHQQFSITTYDDNSTAATGADIVVLAVKPQIMQGVAQGLASTVKPGSTLVISIAAGIRIQDLSRWLGEGTAIIRVMPNTPALVGSGAAALFANPRVSEAQREMGEGILRAVGLTLWLENEALMNAVTALSGSGPAYFFLLMEILEETGVKLGLPREQARLLTLETAFGASKMALESTEDPATLRARVTSPGGATEQALGVLEHGQIKGLFEQALKAAHDRAVALGDILGKG